MKLSPKFSLRIKGTPKMHQLNNRNNKAEAAVSRKCKTKKHGQSDNAIAWCKQNNLDGHSTVSSSSSADSSVVPSHQPI